MMDEHSYGEDLQEDGPVTPRVLTIVPVSADQVETSTIPMEQDRITSVAMEVIQEAMGAYDSSQMSQVHVQQEIDGEQVIMVYDAEGIPLQTVEVSQTPEQFVEVCYVNSEGIEIGQGECLAEQHYTTTEVIEIDGNEIVGNDHVTTEMLECKEDVEMLDEVEDNKALEDQEDNVPAYNENMIINPLTGEFEEPPESDDEQEDENIADLEEKNNSNIAADQDTLAITNTPPENSKTNNENEETEQENVIKEEMKLENVEDASNNEETDKNEEISVSPFMCGICFENFEQLSAFYAHLKTHDDFESYMPSPKGNPILAALNMKKKIDKNMFKCGVCEMAFPSMGLLHEHMVNEEGVSEYKYCHESQTVMPLDTTETVKRTTRKRNATKTEQATASTKSTPKKNDQNVSKDDTPKKGKVTVKSVTVTRRSTRTGETDNNSPVAETQTRSNIGTPKSSRKRKETETDEPVKIKEENTETPVSHSYGTRRRRGEAAPLNIGIDSPRSTKGIPKADLQNIEEANELWNRDTTSGRPKRRSTVQNYAELVRGDTPKRRKIEEDVRTPELGNKESNKNVDKSASNSTIKPTRVSARKSTRSSSIDTTNESAVENETVEKELETNADKSIEDVIESAIEEEEKVKEVEVVQVFVTDSLEKEEDGVVQVFTTDSLVKVEIDENVKLDGTDGSFEDIDDAVMEEDDDPDWEYVETTPKVTTSKQKLRPGTTTCPTCDKIVSKSKLQRHMICHSTERKFMCDIEGCQKTFKCKAHLTDHKRRGVHGKPDMTCNICHKKYTNTKSFEAHMILAHPQDSTVLIKDIDHETASKYLIDLSNGKDPGELVSPFEGEAVVASDDVKGVSDSQNLSWRRYRENGGKRSCADYMNQFIRCSICQKATKRKFMNKHKIIHMTDRPFVCGVDDCKKTFKALSHVQEHKRLTHSPANMPCAICNKTFKSMKVLSIHLAQHLRRNEMKADIEIPNEVETKVFEVNAEDLFTSMYEGTENEEKDTDEYTCQICDKTFSNVHNLKRHLYVHSTERNEACDTCGARFKTKQNLIEHERNVHVENKEYVCSICSMAFKTEKSLWVHKAIHLKRDNEYYSADVILELQAEQTERVKQRQKKMYDMMNLEAVCDICGKTVLQKRLIRHKEIHQKDKIYPCPICNKKYNTQRYVKDHIKKVHNEVRVVCDICGQSFKGRHSAEIHRQTHGPRDKQCPHCPKLFTTNFYLRTHLQTHLEKKSFKCKECGAGFSQKPRLSIHMVEKHGEGEPRPCKYCGMEFPSRQKARIHERKAHEGFKENGRRTRIRAMRKKMRGGGMVDREVIQCIVGENYEVEQAIQTVVKEETEEYTEVIDADGTVTEHILELPENTEQCQILLYPNGTFKVLNSNDLDQQFTIVHEGETLTEVKD